MAYFMENPFSKIPLKWIIGIHCYHWKGTTIPAYSSYFHGIFNGIFNGSWGTPLLSPSPAAPRYCGIPPRELRLELQELRLELRCRTWTAAPRCGVPMMGVIKCYKMVEVFTSYNHYKPTFCPDPMRLPPVSIIFPWKTLKNQSGWTP